MNCQRVLGLTTHILLGVAQWGLNSYQSVHLCFLLAMRGKDDKAGITRERVSLKGRVRHHRRGMTKCFLESIRNRADFWLHAGNHIESGEETRHPCVFPPSQHRFALKAGSNTCAVSVGFEKQSTSLEGCVAPRAGSRDWECSRNLGPQAAVQRYSRGLGLAPPPVLSTAAVALFALLMSSHSQR